MSFYINRGVKADPRYDRNQSLGKMTKDKALVRQIRNGNFNDPGVKREAMRIEQEGVNKRKQDFRENQLKKLEQAKIQLKKSGGYCE